MSLFDKLLGKGKTQAARPVVNDLAIGHEPVQSEAERNAVREKMEAELLADQERRRGKAEAQPAE